MCVVVFVVIELQSADVLVMGIILHLTAVKRVIEVSEGFEAARHVGACRR